MSIKYTDNFDKVDNLLKQATKEALRRVGIKTIATCKANCKVDTGHLRRSHTYRCEFEGEVFTLIIGNTADYSIYVEFKPENKGGRPWFRKSLKNLEKEFIQELKILLR